MIVIYFNTEFPLHTNSDVMMHFIGNINTKLDIYLIEGTYAEGIDEDGAEVAIHASGDGDDFNHKIELELL